MKAVARPADQKVVQAQAQGLRFRQAPAEQAVHQAGENADHNAFPKELELKIVPVEQGLVRLADARIGLPVPLRVEKTAAQAAQDRL